VSQDLLTGREQTAAIKRAIKSNASASDRTFRGIARGGGAFVLLLMTLVGSFLAFRAYEALSKDGFKFITEQEWSPDGGGFGIAAVMVGTVLIAIVAIVVAVPLAVAAALYISEYAPRRWQRFFVGLVDLMAAVPSVVYGLWGAFLLQWKVIYLSRWISDWFGWIQGRWRGASRPVANPDRVLVVYLRGRSRGGVDGCADRVLDHA
jgi:phosphate transport system permease protein